LFDPCSVHIQIYVIKSYSFVNVYPYFTRPFEIISSRNLSFYRLPWLPSHVKYVSSVPDLISINPYNGSIVIRSSSLYTFAYYDFHIRTVDYRTASLTCSMPVRILFSSNLYAPRLTINSTRQTIVLSTSKFLFQIQAYDPDLLINDQTDLVLPSIEYEIDGTNMINIERFTGRIFLATDSPMKQVNFTLIMTDFGQTNRLRTEQEFVFEIKSNENIPMSFLLFGTSIVVVGFLLSLVVLLLICCCCYCSCCRHRRQHTTNHSATSKAHQTTWTNISPNTPDTRLIDHEYVSNYQWKTRLCPYRSIYSSS
jgi:hypothetical protein